MRTRRPGGLERAVPATSLVAVGIIAIAVLPSSLRPPPDQANASAELSPDAPPDETPDAIISSFTQAGSRTAGASNPAVAQAPGGVPQTSTPPPPPPPPPPIRRASSGLCFGNPPRQTESVYAPDCKPAFVGDNGGATSRNVTADQVNIGFWHGATVPGNKGAVRSSPPEGDEGAVDRTLRVLQAYFNQRYETYGRRIQLIFIDTPETSDPGLQQAAARADSEFKVFAATHLGRPFCDELVRRKLVCYSENPFPDADLDKASPYFYSFQMSATRNERLTAEYLCKRLVGGNADYAAGLQKGQPRKFGVLYESDTTGRHFQDFQRAFRDACGQAVVGYDVNDPGRSGENAAQTGVAVASLQNEGVTTIVNYMQFGSQLVAMQSAQSSNYFPEWFVTGSYGNDFNLLGKAQPAGQMAQSFGISGIELPRPRVETECYRAYKSIDPNNNPDDGVCDQYWEPLAQVVTGIQEAGPNLTPETFRQGFYRYGKRYPPEQWAFHGGYAAGDHSFLDRMGEVWWNPRATERSSRAPGAFVWTRNGARFGIGEVPAGKPEELFTSGITSAPRS